MSAFEAWHIDPDRRAAGRRTIDPLDYAPPLPQIETMLRTNANAAIKLAPAADFALANPIDFELEWIGQGRECQQQVAWCGKLANQPIKRSATVLANDGAVIGQIAGSGNEVAHVGPIGAYLIEPHAAVMAAGLVGTFAEQHNLSSIAPRSAYLTGNAPITDCGAGCFRVLLTIPFDERALRRELKTRDLFPEEVKKRQVDIDPHNLAKRLRKTGSRPCTLILTRLEDRVAAIIATR